MSMRDKILRLGEAADELHVSRRQLDRWIDRGVVRAFEIAGIRYVYACDVSELIQRSMRRVPAGGVQ